MRDSHDVIIINSNKCTLHVSPHYMHAIMSNLYIAFREAVRSFAQFPFWHRTIVSKKVCKRLCHTTHLGTICLRDATEKDVPALLWLIQLLAEYENEPNGLKITEKELIRDGFGTNKYFHTILAEQINPSSPPMVASALDSGQTLPSDNMHKNESLIGYAMYFFNYSTWEGRVLYVEDVFIREGYRNRGYGTMLMRECAKVAEHNECARMVWQVLDWNTKAISLYERMGGVTVKEWLTIRMNRTNIKRFSAEKEKI